MDERGVIRTGGAILIVGATAFVIVFLWLARHFDYPGVLAGGAPEVLPAILIGGPTLRGVWSFYSLLPLVFIPAATASYLALRDSSPGTALLALIFGCLAAPAACIGLMRWAGIYWELALAWPTASPAARETITVVFNGFTSYLGTYIGQFLGGASLSVWFILSGSGMVRSERFPDWTGWAGVVVGGLTFLGALRSTSNSIVLEVLATVASVALPVWLIVFGAAIVAYGPRPLVDDPRLDHLQPRELPPTHN